MKKILSIAIAAYNVEKTIEETLEPFLKCRELDKMEVIIVNDGSKDKTPFVVKKYIDQFPNTFVLINKKNGGWGSTVNYGLQHATGKYFKQLDGDDYYNSRNLDMLVYQLEKQDADLIVTPYISFDDRTGKQLDYHTCNPGYKNKKLYTISQIKKFKPFMHAMCVKTDLIKDKIKITENCFYTDTEFVLKTITKVQTILFYDKVIYCYRRASENQSMSLNGLEKHYLDQDKVIRELLTYKNENVFQTSVSMIFDDLLFGTCMWHYLVMLYLKPSIAHRRYLIAFDTMLKEQALDYYVRTDIGTIQKLRKTKFMGYSVAAPLKKRKDGRFTTDGRMIF